MNFHQILFVIDGKGILKCNGNTYELKRGCAFFTAIGVPVEYSNTGGLVTAFLTATGTAVADLMECFSCDGFLFYESIFQYVLNIRLTNARYFLMSDHQASVKDASISCGFDDVSYFCRAYKNKFGKSPAKDRENHFA